MDSISFNSKILLFGEYGIIHDSNALSVPYKKFNGFLKTDNFDRFWCGKPNLTWEI